MSFHHVERYAFDRIFTVPPPRGAGPAGDTLFEVAALRLEVASLRADSAGQVAIAHAEGFDAGLAQARGEREAALLSAVDALQAGVEAVEQEFEEVVRRVTGEAGEVALAAADLLAGRALETAPTAAIDAAIGRALAQVARGTELLVRVHPDITAEVEACVAARQAQDRRLLNLVVAADASLAPGDAQIGWEAGSLALDAAARRAAIHAELAPLLLD
jgi:flagellar assembly protein FliH